MLKEAIKEAATIEEARQAAAAELGLTADEVQMEVLQAPQKKTLGLFGGCPARVRVFVEVTPASAAKEYLAQLLEGMGAKGASIAVKEEASRSGAGERTFFGCGRARRGSRGPPWPWRARRHA